MKRAANSSARNRPRKKAASPESIPPSPSAAPAAVAAPAQDQTPADARNVSSLESVGSLLLGLLFVIAALCPRSLKQLAMLSLGGGLVYRGMTGHCGVYQAFGIDTVKEPLFPADSAKP